MYALYSLFGWLFFIYYAIQILVIAFGIGVILSVVNIPAALSNCKAFVDETFEILKDKKVGLVQADSGFYAHDFLTYLEQEKKTSYIIAVKMYPTVKLELQSKKAWIKLKDGIEITEFEYQSPEWKHPRNDSRAEKY